MERENGCPRIRGCTPSPVSTNLEFELEVENDINAGLKMEITTEQNINQQNTERRKLVLYGNYDKGPLLVILYVQRNKNRTINLPTPSSSRKIFV